MEKSGQMTWSAIPKLAFDRERSSAPRRARSFYLLFRFKTTDLERCHSSCPQTASIIVIVSLFDAESTCGYDLINTFFNFYYI